MFPHLFYTQTQDLILLNVCAKYNFQNVFKWKSYLADKLHSHHPWVHVHLFPHPFLEDHATQIHLELLEVLTHQGGPELGHLYLETPLVLKESE
jgi:hypothetical protein